MAEIRQDTNLPQPNYDDGINYWNTQTADLDGVLGWSHSSRPTHDVSNIPQADLALV